MKVFVYESMCEGDGIDGACGMSMRGDSVWEKKRRFPPQTQSTANNNTTHQHTHHPRTHALFTLIEHT